MTQHLDGPSPRSMHGHGVDEPREFSHDQWVSLRDSLYHSGDKQMKWMGMLMNLMQHYYMELPSQVAVDGRKLAECAVAIALSVESLPSKILAESIKQVQDGPLRANLDTLRKIGNEQGAHLGPRDFSKRKDAVEAAYRVGSSILAKKRRTQPATASCSNAAKPDLVKFLETLGMERHAQGLANEGVCCMADFEYVKSDAELEKLMNDCGMKTIEQRKFKSELERYKAPD